MAVAHLGGPTTRQVSEIRISLGGGTQQLGDLAIQEILNWLENRAGRTLPSAAWKGESFELDDIGAQYASAIRLKDQQRTWIARLDDADKQVAQRDWVTEVGVAEVGDTKVVVGARLSCVTRGRDIPYMPSIPGFVRQLVDKFEASLEERAIRTEPWVVASSEDVDVLLELLKRPSRSNDVIVCSLVGSDVDVSELSIRSLHLRTLGAAHVVALTWPAGYLLTDRVGKRFSVFDGAVRIYRPGFDPERDDPYRHPLRVRSRIAAGPGGAKGYEDFLATQSIGRSVSAIDSGLRLMPFSSAKHAAAEYELQHQREAGASDAELFALVEEEEKAHKRAIEETNELLKIAEVERDDAFRQAEETRGEMYRLRVRLEAVEQKLIERGAPIQTPIPDNLVNFEQWCAEHLSGQVEVLPRAFRGARGSAYEDPQLIYRALLLLRDQYVPLRREGGQERLKAYEASATSLGLKEEGSISRARGGEEGEEYWVNFNGRRYMLDRHLTKGNSRDPRYLFRLYFFWDEDTEQAIVGWLPSHLDTRNT